MILAALIKAYREKLGLSLREMANVVGINYSAIFRLERGQDLSRKQWVKVMKWIISDEPANNTK